MRLLHCSEQSCLRCLGLSRQLWLSTFISANATIVEMAAVATFATVSTVSGRTSRASQYRDFYNMKPPNFDGIQDPIITMSWIYDVYG